MNIQLNDFVAKYFDSEKFFKDSRETGLRIERTLEAWAEFLKLFKSMIGDEFLVSLKLSTKILETSDTRWAITNMEESLTKLSKGFYEYLNKIKKEE